MLNLHSVLSLPCNKYAPFSHLSPIFLTYPSVQCLGLGPLSETRLACSALGRVEGPQAGCEMTLKMSLSACTNSIRYQGYTKHASTSTSNLYNNQIKKCRNLLAYRQFLFKKNSSPLCFQLVKLRVVLQVEANHGKYTRYL